MNEEIMTGENEATEELSELDALKARNAELEKALEERKSISERLEGEISEFSEMFPDVPLSEIPDEIWNEVKMGLPLSASYARHERKRTLSQKKAEEANKNAIEKSSGSVTGTSDHYFTADQVRKMSAAEVKKNYSHIINSMKHWN
jgi:hypothetical protein